MKLILVTVLVFLFTSISCQTFETTNGSTYFIAKINNTPIEAHNKLTSATLSIDSMFIRSSVFIKDFYFKSEKGKDHFLNKTMHTDLYSQATFIGKLKKITDNKYQVIGNLTIHGLTKTILFPAEIVISQNSSSAKATFVIRYTDFEIIPHKKHSSTLSKDILISMDFSLTKSHDDLIAPNDFQSPVSTKTDSTVTNNVSKQPNHKSKTDTLFQLTKSNNLNIITQDTTSQQLHQPTVKE